MLPPDMSVSRPGSAAVPAPVLLPLPAARPVGNTNSTTAFLLLSRICIQRHTGNAAWHDMQAVRSSIGMVPCMFCDCDTGTQASTLGWQTSRRVA
jgi:hypothetical protein